MMDDPRIGDSSCILLKRTYHEHMAESVASLDKLRRRLARLENVRPRDEAVCFSTGHEAVDAWLGGGLGRGRLHEVVAVEGEEAGSAAGFGAMLGVRAGEGRPLLWLRTEAAERRCGRLYAIGLGELGLDGGAVLVGLVADDAALLKAANDAARCAGLGALLVECWGDPKALDLTATRRLMLAAEASGVTVLLLRMAAAESPSAADTRWRVSAAPSVPLADGTLAGAPGHPVFDIELLRRRAGPAGRNWRVEWDRERRAFQEPATAPLSGVVLPVAAV
jgi:protein ImuA